MSTEEDALFRYSRQMFVAGIWDLTFERLLVPRDPGCPCCGTGCVLS